MPDTQLEIGRSLPSGGAASPAPAGLVPVAETRRKRAARWNQRALMVPSSSILRLTRAAQTVLALAASSHQPPPAAERIRRASPDDTFHWTRKTVPLGNRRLVLDP